jgi:PmbA protein
VDRRITNSEGAGVSAQQSHFWAGNSRGFRGGYASSRHSLSVSPIAGKGARHAARRLVQLHARRQ